MDNTFTSNFDHSGFADKLFEFFALANTEFFDCYGLSPSEETVKELKKKLREVEG